MKNLYLMCVFACLCSLAIPAGYSSTGSSDLKAGQWVGSIELAGEANLTIIFNIESDGKMFTATYDIPDRDISRMPVESIDIIDRKIVIVLPSNRGRLEGTISPDGECIKGVWYQRCSVCDCEFRRSGQPPAVNPPNGPEPPSPYETREMMFQNPEAGISLAGTLTIPEGSGPFAAIVLIAGYGPTQRDEIVVGQKSFDVLSDHLTRTGIAVLRFDKRGIGGSGGDFQSATTDDFASDAMAAVNTLASMDNIRKDRIGLLGHSEGAVIAPMLASRYPERIDCMVLTSVPGLPYSELWPMSSEAQMALGGLNPKEIRKTLDEQAVLYNIVSSESDPVKADALLEKEVKRRIAALGEAERSMTGRYEQELAGARSLNTPWSRRFMVLDPREALKKTTCPVLALWGEKDAVNIPGQNRPEVEKSLMEAGNHDVTFQELEGLNFVFQNTGVSRLSPSFQTLHSLDTLKATGCSGMVSKPQTKEVFIASSALKTISDWLWEHWSDTRKE